MDVDACFCSPPTKHGAAFEIVRSSADARTIKESSYVKTMQLIIKDPCNGSAEHVLNERLVFQQMLFIQILIERKLLLTLGLSVTHWYRTVHGTFQQFYYEICR